MQNLILESRIPCRSTGSDPLTVPRVIPSHPGDDRTRSAIIRDGWIVIDTPWPGSEFDLLASNARLPGLSKLALTTAGAARLRTEVPLEECESDALEVQERMRLAEQEHDRASAALTHSDFSAGALDGGSCDPAAVRSLCEAAGWPALERARSAVVELDVPGLFVQASVEIERGELVVSAEIASCDSLSPVCRTALTRMLLLTAGQCRMLKPVLRSTDGEMCARLVVRAPQAPEPGGFLAHALAALSVGARFTTREARLLAEDPGLAQEYLARQPRGAAAQPGVAHAGRRNNGGT